MSFKERFFRWGFLYRWIPTSFLMKFSGKTIIYPFYHYVSTSEEEDFLTRHLYQAKTREEFLKDIQYFKTNFSSISVKDLSSKNRKKGFYFLLSFDDGLRNFHEVVVPILQQEKVHGINFINTDFMDNKDLFFRYKVNGLIDYITKNPLTDAQKKVIKKELQLSKDFVSNAKRALLELGKSSLSKIDYLLDVIEFDMQAFLDDYHPYMTKNQLHEIQKFDFDLGAHSKSHPHYASLPLEEQLQETRESIQILQKEYKMQPAAFAFPFSDDGVSRYFFEHFPDVITFGTAGLKDEEEGIENVQRIPMEYESVYSAETIVKGELILYIVKKILSKHKIKR